MWLTNLKIAIVEKDVDKLSKLMDNIPQLEKKEDIESAIFLLKEATELVLGLKNETSSSMLQIKKNINYLKSTEHKVSKRLDLKS